MAFGGAPRAVWLTTESDPTVLSALAVAQRLDSEGRTAHLVWNPVTGQTAQLLPLTCAAAGQLRTGRVDRASEGRVCAVIQVIGHALAPFTEQTLVGLDPILAWLDSWNVARRWPAGPPPALPQPYPDPAGERLWARGGHFGHSQVPGAQASGPGAISPKRLLNGAVPHPRREDAVPTPAAPLLATVAPSANGAGPQVEMAGP